MHRTSPTWTQDTSCIGHLRRKRTCACIKKFSILGGGSSGNAFPSSRRCSFYKIFGCTLRTSRFSIVCTRWLLPTMIHWDPPSRPKSSCSTGSISKYLEVIYRNLKILMKIHPPLSLQNKTFKNWTHLFDGLVSSNRNAVLVKITEGKLTLESSAQSLYRIKLIFPGQPYRQILLNLMFCGLTETGFNIPFLTEPKATMTLVQRCTDSISSS